MTDISQENADIIGEIANICIGNAATTLSLILGKSTNITAPNVEVLKKEIKVREDKEEALIEECNQIKKKLEGKEISFKVKTGSQDKVFGSISSKQISEELSKLGFDIDKKKIQIDGDINTLGTHNVKIVLHKKVSFDIKVVLKK